MKRADELLAELNLVESRSKARALIEEGKVKANGRLVDKPSRKISEGAKIEIMGGADTLKYVSRAGLKIEAFLDKFEIPCAGADIIDIGASTGGFTDCLLQRGAKSAVCVDVGTNQLHGKIKSDPRVKNLEKTDARSLTSEILEKKLFGILCADLSFISLEKVLPFVWQFVNVGGVAILLVKPQFETPPALMRRTKGIIKDSEIQNAALERIKNFISENFADAEYIGDMPSPIRGGDGNQEFLLGLKKRGGTG
ncbi:MAG: TlyA family RNA methyltransferase [Opitutales bacterium]|nr:TlyA family RNA methyltransferase [Opitutales bacterium]